MNCKKYELFIRARYLRKRFWLREVNLRYFQVENLYTHTKLSHFLIADRTFGCLRSFRSGGRDYIRVGWKSRKILASRKGEHSEPKSFRIKLFPSFLRLTFPLEKRSHTLFDEKRFLQTLKPPIASSFGRLHREFKFFAYFFILYVREGVVNVSVKFELF